jgi:periplasmic copper chaperone A
MIDRATNILARGAVAAGLAGLIAAPAAAVNIPEGGAVTADSLFVINFQVQEGCAGSPTDALEVTIPESVQNPQPEWVSGWDATVETIPAEGDDAEGERTVVRWSGGPLPAGTFKEFGLRARFPDEPGATIAFPVVQTCGTIERAWTDDGGEMAAPTVTLNERFGPRDILDLRDSVAQLRGEVDGLIEQLGDVNVGNLRSRVSDTESGLTDIVDRLDALDEQLGQIADQSQEQ